MFEENPGQILLGRSFDFRYPATRTVRQDSHTSSGLPRTACLPAVTRRGWVALVVTVFAQAYEFSRSRRPGLRRYADVHGPLAEVHRARSHSGLCHRRHRLDCDVDASVRRAARARKSSLNTESA